MGDLIGGYTETKAGFAVDVAEGRRKPVLIALVNHDWYEADIGDILPTCEVCEQRVD